MTVLQIYIMKFSHPHPIPLFPVSCRNPSQQFCLLIPCLLFPLPSELTQTHILTHWVTNSADCEMSHLKFAFSWLLTRWPKFWISWSLSFLLFKLADWQTMGEGHKCLYRISPLLPEQLHAAQDTKLRDLLRPPEN